MVTRSRPTLAAAAILGAVGAVLVVRALGTKEHPDSINDHAQMVLYSRNFSGAQEQHAKFNSAALVALQET